MPKCYVIGLLLFFLLIPSCCLEGLLVQWWSTQTPPRALRLSRPFSRRHTNSKKKTELRRASLYWLVQGATFLHSPLCRHPGPTLGPAAVSFGPGGRSSGPCPGLSLSGCHTAPEDLAATWWTAGGRRSKVMTRPPLHHCLDGTMGGSF